MANVVIVTGASGGIGSAIAKKFGETGAKVVVHYNRSAADADAVAKEINKGPGEAMTYKADVRNYEEIRAMVQATIAKWGRIDVLVNNAGGSKSDIREGGLPAWEIKEEVWDTVLDINLKGNFLCTKAVAPYMIEQKGGYIINMSSGMGLQGKKGSSAYSAAKAGIIGFTKAVARELGDYNVKVNVILPGMIRHKNIINENRRSEEDVEAYKRAAVLHRTGTPEELAATVVHITTLQNISGQTIKLDSTIY
ncbi:MAG: SDR family NAD(P)-dependent oxidoreductase [Chloroflexi bacterium]|nr:SDR family NAD(P)-dependent oxidoreductase [Chloroflexota bacterium]